MRVPRFNRLSKRWAISNIAYRIVYTGSDFLIPIRPSACDTYPSVGKINATLYNAPEINCGIPLQSPVSICRYFFNLLDHWSCRLGGQSPIPSYRKIGGRTKCTISRDIRLSHHLWAYSFHFPLLLVDASFLIAHHDIKDSELFS